MKGSLHVLIIDDDPDDVEFLSGAFSRLYPDTRFTTVPNGQAALDMLLTNQITSDCPDVAFLDLHMPGMDGHQVLTALRATECCRDFPILVVSTSLMPSEGERCRLAGCTDYFMKPVSLDDYDTIVNKAVSYLPEIQL